MEAAVVVKTYGWNADLRGQRRRKKRSASATTKNPPVSVCSIRTSVVRTRCRLSRWSHFLGRGCIIICMFCRQHITVHLRSHQPFLLLRRPLRVQHHNTITALLFLLLPVAFACTTDARGDVGGG